jgi:hypothetical protein
MKTVPQNHPATQEEKLHDARVRRCSARMKVVDNLDANGQSCKISDGAQRLYAKIDDRAGWKGLTWAKPKTLSEDLKVTEREIQRRMKELIAAGHIFIRRGRRERLICLSWNHIQDTTDRSVEESSTDRLVVSEVPQPTDRSFPEDLSLYEPVLKKEPVRAEARFSSSPSCRCGGSGWWNYESIGRDGAVRNSRIRCQCQEQDWSIVSTGENRMMPNVRKEGS